MRKRKLWIQLLIFLCAFAVPGVLVSTVWELALVGAAYALCGALGLWAGWVFLWGTIDQARVAALLGSPEALAQQLPLPEPVVPPLPPGPPPPEVALAAIVPDAMRLPPVELQPVLDSLPKGPPRPWQLRSMDAAQALDKIDYLALAGTDVAKELEHIEQILVMHGASLDNGS